MGAAARTTVRVAMWSGPRNISTALMRSFASRPDCEVVDEPLYSYYLTQTGLDHPGREEIIASQPSAWQDVAAQLNAMDPPMVYVKHMAHHLLPDVAHDWLSGWRHAFLLRDPAAMITSLAKVLPFRPRLSDTGLPQQVELFGRFGGPVIAAEDVLADPAAALEGLCRQLGIPWTEAMLSWPAGPHPADGVWAPYWYRSVWESTGFGAPSPPPPEVDADLEPLLEQARELHAMLAAHRQ